MNYYRKYRPVSISEYCKIEGVSLESLKDKAVKSTLGEELTEETHIKTRISKGGKPKFIVFSGNKPIQSVLHPLNCLEEEEDD